MDRSKLTLGLNKTIWHIFLSFNAGSLLLEPSPKLERKRSSSKSRKKKKEKSKRKESDEDSDCEDNDALSSKNRMKLSLNWWSLPSDFISFLLKTFHFPFKTDVFLSLKQIEGNINWKPCVLKTEKEASIT